MPDRPTAAPDAELVPAPEPDCSPHYSGACVPNGLTDVDCAGGPGDGPLYIEGPIDVVDEDTYGLDANANGIGCESPSDDSGTGTDADFILPDDVTGSGGDGGGTTAAGSRALPRTGVDAARWAGEATSLAVLGGTLLVATRRRRRWPVR